MAADSPTIRWTIDLEASEPAYRQIEGHLRREIERRERVPGDRLPTIRALAAALGLHRDTVALAYESLAEAGWVEARVGAGTFVRGVVAGWAETARAARDGAPLVESGQRQAVDSNPAGSIAPGTRSREDDERVLAPAVERLITLENTRPRYETGPDVVALHRLIPDPRFYPIDAFRECVDTALREEGPDLFSYAPPEGDERLRRAMAGRFRALGMMHAPEEFVLCHGASQGISLAMRLFAEPGDQIAVEVPTYANVLSAFAGQGLQAAPVPMDDEGPEIEALDRTLAKPEVKAFYTIPSFHNPLGTTTSLARRHAILEVAARHDVPVIEDGFELDLRFDGPEIPPLAALDRSGLVVLLFSFSKSLFPGVRVGSLAARGRALEGLVALKHATDLSDALPLQAGLARFVESGSYDRHLVRMRKVLRSRHKALNEALEEAMPASATWTRPEGGYQLWLALPAEIDTRDLLADAARAGVLYSPGTLFMPDGRPSNALRLTVACADEKEIERGISALGDVVRARMQTGRAASRQGGMHL